MIEQKTHTTYYAVIRCDHEGCRGCESVHDYETPEDALGNLHTEMNASGWTFDGDKHYCPEHRPLVIDANQMELGI